MAVPVGSPVAAGQAERPAGGSGDLEELEVRLLLEAIYHRYGYDFRQYALSSIKRRIRHHLREEGLGNVSRLQERLLHQPGDFERFVSVLTVPVTSMFRDPGFFAAFREKAVPLLRTYPFLRFWHAGCSTGEEVYSMAILLEEEGLYERCRIYATDMNESMLREAQKGHFPVSSMQVNTANYLNAAGRGPFSRYYTVKGESAIFEPRLRRNVIFALHNLATDGAFNEFNAVFCRNVLIYFGKGLQDRVHGLLYESLERFGYLGLGSKESLRLTPFVTRYEELDGASKLYRKVA
jgi:chemotaxis protein methyltransferase CheR